MRRSHCSEQFGGQKDMIKNCSTNFCSFCCESKYRNFFNVRFNGRVFILSILAKAMLSEILICEKECAETEKADTMDAFQNCIDPFDPLHSVARFCTTSYPEKEEKWLEMYCQRDMCQMCCITTAVQFEINVKPEQVKECQMACKNKFWV